MTNIPTWSSTDASNNSAAPAGAPEGMQAGKLNDTIRAVMGAAKRLFEDQRGSITTAGSSNAFTVTTANTFTAMAQIPPMVITLDRANTGAATMNVDGIGAKSWYKQAYADFKSGELKADMQVLLLPNVAQDCFEAVLLNNMTVPKGHLYGLGMSNAADTAHDITIAAGEAVDKNGVELMELSSGITKRIDSSWAVGGGNGGLDTGSVAANTTYHLHLIKRSDTGVVDVLFSVALASPTMPANYDYSRRIGSVVTDASANIYQFKQFGDEFRWRDSSITTDHNGSGSRSYSLLSLKVPSGLSLVARLDVAGTSTGTDDIEIGDGDDSSQTQDVTIRYNAYGGAEVNPVTDTSGRIYLAYTLASQVTVRTLGWRDTRGKY